MRRHWARLKEDATLKQIGIGVRHIFLNSFGNSPVNSWLDIFGPGVAGASLDPIPAI